MTLKRKSIACRYLSPGDSATVLQEQLFLKQLLVISLGLMAGLLAAYCLSFVKWDFSSELLTANDLGIVSLTILDNYPKSLDLVTYFALLVLPVTGALVFWLVWARGVGFAVLATLFLPLTEDAPVRPPSHPLQLGLMIPIYLLFSLAFSGLVFVGFSYTTDMWPFLGEEGVNLAWVQAILRGGVYAKDFFSPYGPMLVYPLTWWMKLFGVSVITARFYTLFLDLLAAAVYLAVFYRTLGNRWVFFSTSLLFGLFCSRLAVMAPNTTMLRVALGILPLFLLYRWIESKNGRLLFAAGLAVGQSFLFSQEVGICACAGMVAMIVVSAVSAQNFRFLYGSLRTVLLGAALSMAPMLLYLAAHGALEETLKNLYLNPRLFMLGSGGLKFPGIQDFFQTPFSIHVFPALWIIIVYVIGAVILTIFLLLRRVGAKSVFAAGLLIFGVLLFRTALGRSDYAHYIFAAPPAFLLLCLCIDRAFERFDESELPLFSLSRKTVGILALFLMLLAGTINPMFKLQLQKLFDAPARFEQLKSMSGTRNERYTLERAGVLFEPEELNKLALIRSEVDRITRKDDYVLFFPNEAAYYFLFDRRNPTRYVVSYFAVTSQQRVEMVADLERNKPEYIIFSPDTWRVDNISEEIQVPELVNYISNKYEWNREVADVIVLRRKKV